MKSRKEKKLEKTLKLLNLFIDKDDGKEVDSIATSLVWDLSRFDKGKELVNYLNKVIELAKKFEKR